jgi:hypothetical protein
LLQTYPLGQQAELLVVVRKDHAGASIVCTTDIQDDVILHWGVKKSGKADWLLPPPSIVPPSSVAHPVRSGIPDMRKRLPGWSQLAFSCAAGTVSIIAVAMTRCTGMTRA